MSDRQAADVTDELLGSIALLLEARRDRSALMLLYSSIDILGALSVQGGAASESSFRTWCDSYMRPVESLGCTAEELYSARCGILHNMSAKTSRSSKGTARELVYVRDVLGGPMMPAPRTQPGIVLINPSALWLCFREAVRAYLNDVARGGELAAQVAANLKNVYVTIERR